MSIAVSLLFIAYAIMKFEVFALRLNANVTETLLQDYYNDKTVVDLNQIGFKIAFAVQNEET